MSDTPPSPSPNSITLREIVTVLIRLFAINFGFYTLNTLFFIFLRGQSMAGFKIDRVFAFDALMIAIFLFSAYWLWQLAGFVARQVTRGFDSSLSATQLTLLDLYSFGFLLVGLYFAVDNFGPALSWLHYAVTHGASEANLSPDQKSNFYTLFKYLVKLILGLALALNGRKLGAKLVRRDQTAPPASTAPVS
jgi:hypothetical protein